MTETPPPESPLFGVIELDPQVLETYARLWQFETWLRRLVYVQLRAADGDGWEGKIRAAKAKMPKENDKRLSHMPTPEDGVLSFVQLSELTRVIADVGADSNLSHRAGRMLSQGWKPTLRWSAVDKCKVLAAFAHLQDAD